MTLALQSISGPPPGLNLTNPSDESPAFAPHEPSTWGTGYSLRNESHPQYSHCKSGKPKTIFYAQSGAFGRRTRKMTKKPRGLKRHISDKKKKDLACLKISRHRDKYNQHQFGQYEIDQLFAEMSLDPPFIAQGVPKTTDQELSTLRPQGIFDGPIKALTTARQAYGMCRDAKQKIDNVRTTLSYPSGSNEDIFDVMMARVEDIVAYLTCAFDFQTWKGFLGATALYVRTHYKGSICKMLLQYVPKLLEGLVVIGRVDLTKLEAQDGIFHPQDGEEGVGFTDFLKLLKTARSNWAHFVTNPLSQMLGNLMSFAAMAGFMPEDSIKDGHFFLGNFKMMAVKAWDVQKSSKTFFEAALDTAIFFLERGHLALVNMNPFLFLYSNSDIDLMDKEYSSLIAAIPLLNSGRLEMFDDGQIEGIKNESDYDHRLHRLIAKYEEMLQVETHGAVRSTLNSKLLKLKQARVALVQCQQNANIREKPYAVNIYGNSGVGKTTINTAIMKVVAQCNGFRSDKKSCASINEYDKFDTEITSETVCATVDDYANIRPDRQAEPGSRRIIDFVNNQPKNAVKADLVDKGTQAIRLKFFSVTTNVKDLNAYFDSCEPASILRRFNVTVTVKLRDSHRNEMGMLDSSVTAEDPDAWLLTLERVKLRPNVGRAADYEFVTIMKDVSLSEALEFFKRDSDEHFRQQRHLVKMMESTYDLDLCEHGMPPFVCAKCAESKSLAERLEGCTFHDAIESPPKPGWFDFFKTEPEIPSSTMYGQDAYVDADQFDLPPSDEVGSKPARRKLPKLPQRPARDDEVEKALEEYDAYRADRQAKVDPLNRRRAKSGPKGLGPQNGEIFECRSVLELEDSKFYDALTVDPSWGVCRQIQDHFERRFACSDVTRQAATLASSCSGKAKYFWSKCGEYVRKAEEEVPAYGTLNEAFRLYWRETAIAVCGSAVIYKVIDLARTQHALSQLEPQGITQSKPEKLPDEVPDPWYKVVPQPVPRSLHSIGATPEQLEETISNHLGVVKVGAGEVRKFAMAFPLKGNYWLLPWHTVKSCYDTPLQVEIRTKSKTQLGKNIVQKIDRSCVKRVPETDFAVVQLVQGGDVPNLMRFLMLGKYWRRHLSAKVVWKDPVTYEPSSDQVLMREFRENLSVKGIDVPYPAYIYDFPTGSFDGLCMAPLIAQMPCASILGFHLAGRHGRALSAAGFISMGQISTVLNEMSHKGLDVCSSGNMETNQYGIDFTPGPVHPKHVTNFLDPKDGDASLEVFGEIPGGRVKFRSNVRKSVISDSVKKHTGLANLHGPPPSERAKRYWRNDLVKIATPSANVVPAIFELAMKDLRETYRRVIPSKSLQEVRVLPIDYVCGGCDGIRGIDRVDLSTSVGFPLNKPKHQFASLGGEPVEGITEPVRFEDTFLEHLKHMENCWLKGERAYPICRGCLKDEPTKLGKDKMRVFAGCQLAFVLAVRKYFLNIMRVIQYHWKDLETAVGINCYGTQWSELAHKIQKFRSGKYIAGDYGGFDKHVSPLFTSGAMQQMIWIAERSGNYSWRDLRIMEGIKSEISNPIYEFDGVLVRAFGSLPSGVPNTVFCNNDENSLYKRYAYYALYLEQGTPVEDIPPFTDRVNSVNYGDDGLDEVHPDETVYTHTSVQRALADIGVTFTMADKKSESIPFIPLEDVSFLKRGFKYDDTLREWLAPLEEESIQKSLHNYMHNKNCDVLPEEISAQAIQGAMREYFRHGQTLYNVRREQLTRVLEECQLTGYVEPIPSYTDAVAYYEERKDNTIPESKTFTDGFFTVYNQGYEDDMIEDPQNRFPQGDFSQA